MGPQKESWTLKTYFHSESEAYSSKSSVTFFKVETLFSKAVSISSKDSMIGFNVQRLNMKFLPVRVRIVNK